MRASYRLGDLFTDDDFKRAAQIMSETDVPISRLEKEVVEPRIGQINAITHQKNSARYFAYVLEYALGEFSKRGNHKEE